VRCTVTHTAAVMCDMCTLCVSTDHPCLLLNLLHLGIDFFRKLLFRSCRGRLFCVPWCLRSQCVANLLTNEGCVILCFFDTEFRFTLPQLGEVLRALLFRGFVSVSSPEKQRPTPLFGVECHACGLCTYQGSKPINHNIKTVPNPATPSTHTHTHTVPHVKSLPTIVPLLSLPTFPILSPPLLLLLLLTARDPTRPPPPPSPSPVGQRSQAAAASRESCCAAAARCPRSVQLVREGGLPSRREVIHLLAVVVSGCAGLQSILVSRLLLRDLHLLLPLVLVIKRAALALVTLELLCIVPVAAQTINHGYHSLWSPQASRHWWSHARSPQEA
jgi:hypothetical protein